MISNKYKCIHVHIPRTGGTSIESKICEEENTITFRPDHRTILDLEPFSLKKIANLYQKNQLVSACRRSRHFLQKKKVGNYYRTTNKKIYNSYFKFTIVRNPWSRAYSWYREVINRPSDCSFNDFICYHIENHPALRPQLYWLRDTNKDIALDFIGRFEQLETDFAKIAKIIQLKNSSLPKKEFTGKSNSYIDVYDNKMKDIIFKKYREEINYFGFEYGE